jgi:5-hydroxyisourate hydrolase
MSALSTHVLDTVQGEPARGVVVRLLEAGGREIGRGVTDADGRISDFGIGAVAGVGTKDSAGSGTEGGAGSGAEGGAGAGPLAAGVYRLVFDTEGYVGEGAFFPEVVVTFRADGRRPKYHVPLLLSSYSYSTYRGS